jgi:acetyl-CoA acyltransferase
MRNAVIVDSVRTGLAKSFRGGFNNTRADNMTAHVVNALLERNPKVDASMVEDIILGCGNPEGAQGHNIARNVAVLSNLPIETGGVTINRYCSSVNNEICHHHHGSRVQHDCSRRCQHVRHPFPYGSCHHDPE